MNNSETNDQVTFMTVAQFKAECKVNTLDVVESPKTNKLFVALENGDNYKAQGDLDVTKEMKFLIPEAGISEACLVNVKPSGRVLATL